MISKEEVLHLAELARLEVSDGEVASLQKDISNILEYIEAVSQVEIPQGDALTSGLTKASPLLRNVMRDDVPRLDEQSRVKADALRTNEDTLAGKEETLRAAFPKRENNFNIVRKIIQKDE